MRKFATFLVAASILTSFSGIAKADEKSAQAAQTAIDLSMSYFEDSVNDARDDIKTLISNNPSAIIMTTGYRPLQIAGIAPLNQYSLEAMEAIVKAVTTIKSYNQVEHVTVKTEKGDITFEVRAMHGPFNLVYVTPK